VYGLRESEANVRLVCGSIWKYGWDEIRVWAHSLHRAKIDARKIVFCRDINPDVKSKLRELGIETQDWTCKNPRLHPITTRWEPILEHLSSNDYEWVICTDIKDCIYQRDPFPFLESQDRPIVLATESIVSSDPIWNQENYKWMVEYLGSSAGPMKHQEVVCGGTVTGRGRDLYELLGDMYIRLAQHKNPRLIDQAVLNHLAHTTYRDSVYIPRLKEGFILSGNFCWHSKFDPPPDFRQGVAYPQGGSIPFCLYHLYFPKHRQFIQTRYWHKGWDGTCNRCGANDWGPKGFYGPICKKCNNRYGYRA
jgi:hypothetical protein